MVTISNADFAALVAYTQSFLDTARRINPSPPTRQYNYERRARLLLRRLAKQHPT